MNASSLFLPASVTRRRFSDTMPGYTAQTALRRLCSLCICPGRSTDTQKRPLSTAPLRCARTPHKCVNSPRRSYFRAFRAIPVAIINRPFLLNSFSAFQARAVLATEAIIRSPPSAIRAYASVARAFFPHSATSAAGRPSHHSGLSRSGRRQSSQSAAEHEEQ